MTTLPIYKGYQGSVEYDDGSLLVRILHIADAVTATCDAASDAIRVFEQLVDDYLETCAETGDEPNRPFKGSFNVRIEPELHRIAALAAAAGETTLNSWVEEALEEKVAREKSERSFALQDISPSTLPLPRAERPTAESEAPDEDSGITHLDAFRQKRMAGR
jgi:predicted HicB family RNase H-like nuclease